MTSGQTRESKSFLLTISFGVEVKTTNRSRARAPNSTGAPCLVRRRSFASRLNGPNDKPRSVRLITVAMDPSVTAPAEVVAVPDITTLPANHKGQGVRAFPRPPGGEIRMKRQGISGA